MDYRRSHFCESDKTTLVNFKRAIDGDWKKERQQTRQQQQLRPVIWFILLAIVLMCGMMIIIAVSLALRPELQQLHKVFNLRWFYFLR